MRESDGVRSKFIEGNKKLGSPLEIIPVETKLEGGFPDAICLRKSDGRVALVEMKYVRKAEKKMEFRINQPLFLRRWASLCPGVTKAWVFARVEIPSFEGWYLFRAEESTDWVRMIKLEFRLIADKATKHWKLDSREVWKEIQEILYC